MEFRVKQRGIINVDLYQYKLNIYSRKMEKQKQSEARLKYDKNSVIENVKII